MRERVQLNFAQRWRVKLKEPKQAAMKRTKRILAGAAVGIAIAAIGSLPWVYELRLATDLNMLNQQIAAMQELDSQVYQLDTLKNRINSQEQLLTLINEKRKDPSEVLNRLQEHLPSGSILEGFTLNPDNSFKVSITFRSPVDVASFWSSMKNSEYYEVEDINTLSLDDKEQTLYMEFRLK